MGLKFKAGETVKQVTPTIQGEVSESRVIGNEIMVFVTYIGADGQQHERAFREDELEAVPAGGV